MNKRKITIFSTSLLVFSAFTFFGMNSLLDSNVSADNELEPKLSQTVVAETVSSTVTNSSNKLNPVLKPHKLKYLPAISNEGMIEPLNVVTEEKPSLEETKEVSVVEKPIEKKEEKVDSPKKEVLKKEAEKQSEEMPVDSLDVFQYTDEEFNILAKIIHAEAGAEPYEGKVAVGAVVLNRVKHEKFGDSIEGVVMAKGQFEPVSNGRYSKSVPSREDYSAALDALNGVDPTKGATYFYAPSLTKNTWHETLNYLTTIGNHRFFNQE